METRLGRERKKCAAGEEAGVGMQSNHKPQSRICQQRETIPRGWGQGTTEIKPTKVKKTNTLQEKKGPQRNQKKGFIGDSRAMKIRMTHWMRDLGGRTKNKKPIYKEALETRESEKGDFGE